MLVYRNLYEIGIQDRNLTIRNISIIRNSTVMNMKISVGYIRIKAASPEAAQLDGTLFAVLATCVQGSWTTVFDTINSNITH